VKLSDETLGAKPPAGAEEPQAIAQDRPAERRFRHHAECPSRPGQDTLRTYMLGQLRRAMKPDVNAISTALLALTLVLLSLFYLLTRKKD